MRIRFFVLGVSATLMATGFAVQACGGDSESTPGTVDSGSEAASAEASVDAAKADTGTDAGTPGCDTSKDFLAEVPDASIADGATTSGICLGCLKTKCATPIDKCGKDCNCRAVVSDVLGCFSEGEELSTCFFSSAETPSSATQSIGISLLGCVQGACKDDCAGAALLDGGLDAN